MNLFNVIKDGLLPTMINILLFTQATVINAQTIAVDVETRSVCKS